MIYYINGNNSGGAPTGTDTPYTTPADGANNFNTLFTYLNSTIRDGDIIEVCDGDIIDDTASTIILYFRLTIRTTSGKNIPIHVHNNVGVVDYAGCEFKNMNFYNEEFIAPTLLISDANGAIVNRCKFSSGTTTSPSKHILIVSSDGCLVERCELIFYSTASQSACISVMDSLYTTIRYNRINFLRSGIGIDVISNTGSGNNVSANIYGNIIFNSSNTSTDSMVGINYLLYNDIQTKNVISNNAIILFGTGANGIIYGCASGTNDDIGIIKNNVISLGDAITGVGIYMLPPNGHNPYIEVVNNIIYYISGGYGYSGGGNTNTCFAISVSIKNGIIDYNDIFGFDKDNIFINNGDTENIQLGSRNIFVDPKLVEYTSSPSPYGTGEIGLYKCNTNSECLGSGMGFTNIGLGVEKLYDDDDYLTIVDTVTDNIGQISADKSRFAPTFFNNVLREKPSDYNNWYRDNNGPYKSDIYNNQWEYNRKSPSTFPFEKGDHFYNRDFNYVLENKGLLAPFEGIECPANPGWGYPDYHKYKYGLWGYPRATYRNNCIPDPCIIQDSISSDIIIQDTVNDVTYWIFDKVNPDCLEEDI